MDAKELRIGNWAIKHEIKFSGIKQTEIKVNAVDIMQSTSLKPIPLTEEWMLKFGFQKINHITNGVLYKMDWLRISASLNSEWRGAPIKRDAVQYVHQLQNLYFALTGEELELKYAKDFNR